MVSIWVEGSCMPLSFADGVMASIRTEACSVLAFVLFVFVLFFWLKSAVRSSHERARKPSLW